MCALPGARSIGGEDAGRVEETAVGSRQGRQAAMMGALALTG
jgi:hypothetical protein